MGMEKRWSIDYHRTVKSKSQTFCLLNTNTQCQGKTREESQTAVYGYKGNIPSKAVLEVAILLFGDKVWVPRDAKATSLRTLKPERESSR